MRRYLQFRLRSLFLLTTLAAIGCMVAPSAVERYREYHRRPIEMIAPAAGGAGPVTDTGVNPAP